MVSALTGADPGLIEEIWEQDVYRTRGRIRPGDRIIDVGANVGVFTLQAAFHGAHCLAVEPWLPNLIQLVCNINDTDIAGLVQPVWAAVGPEDGWCGISRCGIGVHTEQTGDDVPMWSFASLCGPGWREMIKIDVEGAEYGFLIGADLSRVKFLAVEFHVWATEPTPGLGVRDYPMEHHPQDLIDWISRTHTVEIVGDVETGGYLYGELCTL